MVETVSIWFLSTDKKNVLLSFSHVSILYNLMVHMDQTLRLIQRVLHCDSHRRHPVIISEYSVVFHMDQTLWLCIKVYSTRFYMDQSLWLISPCFNMDDTLW